MAIGIFKNERMRQAFRFGRQAALRSANNVVDQLYAQLDQQRVQLDAARKQLAFERAEAEKEKAILVRDLMAAKYEIAKRDMIDTFAKVESPSAMVH